MKKALVIMALLILGIIASSCNNDKVLDATIKTTTMHKQSNDPVQLCIQLCMKARQQGINLSNGPCLSDIMQYNSSEYVCDVAHWPRQSIDNNPNNQCKEYRQGLKKHFVEVTPDCRFIRKY